MKSLCSILVIYIFYLVSLPCADKDLIDHHLSEQSASSDNQEMPDSGDTCSPFCACTCCSVHIILNNIVLYSHPSTTFQIVDIIYNRGVEILFSSFIWQPPKIG
jgi:hypothetical protein